MIHSATVKEVDECSEVTFEAIAYGTQLVRGHVRWSCCVQVLVVNSSSDFMYSYVFSAGAAKRGLCAEMCRERVAS